MAKKQDEVVAYQDPGALAALDFGDHAGQGKQNMTSADQAIPFLSVLQALSKVISDPTKKIKGAEAGMLMDSVAKQLYDGEEGVIFVPCNTARVFVEWQGEPGSGTVVGRFAPSDPQVKAAEKKFAFNKLQTVRGNRLVETFYVIGMVLPSSDAVVPSGFAVLACKSTMIKPYKESIGVLRTLPGNAPLYAFKLRLRTKAETRPKGTSYNLVIMPDGYEGNVFKDGVMGCVIKPDSEQAVLYKLAKQLADDFDNGAANIAYDTEGSHGGDGEGAGSENEPY